MAGLALGAKLFLPQTKVHGMMVDTDPFDEITPRLMRGAAALIGADVEIDGTNYDLRDMCGPGYAIPSEAGNAAVALMAEKEGLFLDPVYTGKAFAGLIEMAREGAFRPEDRFRDATEFRMELERIAGVKSKAPVQEVRPEPVRRDSSKRPNETRVF